MFRQIHSGDRRVEHTTKRHAVYIAGMHSEADDPPRRLIHDDENPVHLQGDGFTPKQIDAPLFISIPNAFESCCAILGHP